MKILYLHQYFSGKGRSGEFSKFLCENGIKVDVIMGDIKEEQIVKNDNLSVYSTNTRYSHHMSKWERIGAFVSYCVKAFLQGMKLKDYDVIFATSTPLTVGLPAVLLSKFKKKKLIFEVRDVWPDIPIEMGYIKSKFVIKILKSFELWIYKNSAHIIVLSEGMRQNLLSKGVSKEKVTVIENMSILYIYDDAEAKKSTFCLDNIENKFVCIHPGTMGHVNGLDFILDVAKKILLLEKDNIVFLLIGEGNRKEHLRQRVEQEGISNVIIKDSIPKTEIAKVILASDLGIMCVDTRYKILEDNSANKFFDFLAAGLPVLINYGGWQKEVLEDTESGKSDVTPEAMAKTIIRLKNDEEQRLKMGKNARELAEKRYSDIIAKEKLLAVLEYVYQNENF